MSTGIRKSFTRRAAGQRRAHPITSSRACSTFCFGEGDLTAAFPVECDAASRVYTRAIVSNDQNLHTGSFSIAGVCPSKAAIAWPQRSTRTARHRLDLSDDALRIVMMNIVTAAWDCDMARIGKTTREIFSVRTPKRAHVRVFANSAAAGRQNRHRHIAQHSKVGQPGFGFLEAANFRARGWASPSIAPGFT